MSTAESSADPASLDDPDLDEAMRRYRRELHVYCYRMLGSFDDAEDHVQEVFLRAWRSRDSFQHRANTRAWLYRIATNVCLDTLRRHRPRAVPDPSGGSSGLSVATMPWLQPYPDALLDELVSDQPDPETLAMTRESISLAFQPAAIETATTSRPPSTSTSEVWPSTRKPTDFPEEPKLPTFA